MRQRLCAVMVMTLFLGILAGCQAMTGETAGENVDDATLTTSVKAALARDKLANLTRIDVDTVRGVVSLNGVVPTPADKARAVQIAQGVKGVKRVIDNLQVQKT
jgi:hyperosmotically inducible periplasmic protein